MWPICCWHLEARGIARSPFAPPSVRAAPGLPRQLLTESALLAMLGSAGGATLAWIAVSTLAARLPRDLTADATIEINLPILAFAIALAVASGLLCGMAPAFQLSTRDTSGPLVDQTGVPTTRRLRGGVERRGATSGGRSRTGRALVAAEIALAVMLLMTGGLLVRSLLRLSDVDPGFRPDSTLTFRIELPRSRYSDPSRWSATLDDLMARLEAMPAVTAAGAISWLPLTTNGGSNALFVEGQALPGPGEETYVVYRLITPGYFRAMAFHCSRAVSSRAAIAPVRCAWSSSTGRWP
jgi:putative ABC transport system permease protein